MVSPDKTDRTSNVPEDLSLGKKLSSMLAEEMILYGMNARTKREAVEELGSFVAERRPSLSKEAIAESVMAREQECTTAIGRKSAFPHGVIDGLDGIVVALGISKTGVDFDAINNAPVNFIVLILTSEKVTGEYLGTLAAFASLSRHPEKMHCILQAESAADLLKTIESLDITI